MDLRSDFLSEELFFTGKLRIFGFALDTFASAKCK